MIDNLRNVLGKTPLVLSVIDEACHYAELIEQSPYEMLAGELRVRKAAEMMFSKILVSHHPRDRDHYTTWKDEWDKVRKLLSGEKSFVNLGLTREEASTGILAIRSFYANLAYTYRMAKLGPTLPGFPFWLTGFTIIPNFMGSKFAEKIVRDTCFTADVAKSPENMFWDYVKTDYFAKGGGSTEVLEFIYRLRTIICSCMGVHENHPGTWNQLAKNTFFQKVNNVPGNGDVQKVLHSDTYYDALKFWYFPKDVKKEDGPFVYVPMSHVLSQKRLQFIQDQSMKYYNGSIEDWRTYGHAEGSLRISQEELKEMGLKESLMTVAGDTLVVANVFGFHRRAEAHVPSERLAIHGSIRYDSPFTL